MSKDPKIMEAIEKTMVIYKIESNPILSVLCGLAKELLTDENGDCQCPRCAAKREEEKAQNN